MILDNIKYFLVENKKRGRPWGVIIFSFLILVLPLFFYQKKARIFKLDYLDWYSVLETFSLNEIIISLSVLICSIGLFFVIRAIYFLFVGLALAFIFYNTYIFFAKGDIFNIESVILAFFGVAVFVYFTSQEHSAPYLRGRHGGWRREIRRSFDHFLTIDGKRRKSININSRGVLVTYKNPEYKINERLKISFTINKETFSTDAIVVRVSNDDIALAFLDMGRKERKKLYFYLQALEEQKTQRHENL